MTIAEIREKAKTLSITKTVGVKKGDLVRNIQRAEGNFPCFGTAASYCDQWSCCFREDCIGNNC